MAIQVMLDWVPWFFTAKVCLRFRYFWWSDLFSKKICFQKMYFLSYILQNYGLMCAWIELKILLVYTTYAKGSLVQNDALIVPNYGH